MTDEQKIDGRTKRALDTAISKRQVSQDSYRAVMEGRITLQEAKGLGREGSPFGPAPKTISKNDRTPTETPCLCGCGLMVPRRFAPGHDARMFRVAREHLPEGRELTDEQTEYLYESGKLERVGARLAEEERERHERAAKKAGK